ncbi:MAG TPA: hypothetical protein VGP85_24365 [Pyrinomonadaceae bacterium]|nr:hypothetical protein [Pyrinomonadaceae bacterium]
MTILRQTVQGQNMLTHVRCVLALIAFSAIASLWSNSALAQNSISEFHDALRANVAFNESDFATLAEGQTVVRLLPVTDKREVAVFGLVGLQVPAQVFLQSFRESIIRKSNPAILEIGKFGASPTPSDLETLTFDDRDLDDLKDCVVGDCKLKLSAKMIERLRREVNWDAADYRIQATQLLKSILLDYVRDYLARGDVALIEYNDKPKVVHLADELRALLAESSYGDKFPAFQQHLNGSNSQFSVVENAIVWSKIKFGLKPVIAFNHIIIYKLSQKLGPQVLITSKQIYANHYFDSSLSLTAFVTIPGESDSYLLYENRSRADGLGGLFGKMKRGLVEDKAVDNLKNILESSKTNLNAHALKETESATPGDRASSWRGWKPRRVHAFLSLLFITAFVAFFTLCTYQWKSSLSGRASH